MEDHRRQVESTDTISVVSVYRHSKIWLCMKPIAFWKSCIVADFQDSCIGIEAGTPWSTSIANCTSFLYACTPRCMFAPAFSRRRISRPIVPDPIRGSCIRVIVLSSSKEATCVNLFQISFLQLVGHNPLTGLFPVGVAPAHRPWSQIEQRLEVGLVVAEEVQIEAWHELFHLNR